VRRLEGEGDYKSTDEIFLEDRRSIFPDFHIISGFIDEERRKIQLFATFQDFTTEDNDTYYCVIYISDWKLVDERYANPSDIKTVEDALNIEWCCVMYSIAYPDEKEVFYSLLEEYQNESEGIER
jgi:hypothetical protein